MANNLDRLFRENLDQLEITPSDTGWKKVRSQLHHRRNPAVPILKTAAVILLLLSAGIVFVKVTNTKDETFIVSNDFPKNLHNLTIEVPERSKIESNTTKIENTNKTIDLTAKKIQSQSYTELKVEFKTYAVSGLRDVVFTDDLSETRTISSLTTTNTAPHITIIYIPTERTGVTDSSENTRINRFLTLAREVKPTDLLADIRDVKDNLLKGINSK